MAGKARIVFRVTMVLSGGHTVAPPARVKWGLDWITAVGCGRSVKHVRGY